MLKYFVFLAMVATITYAQFESIGTCPTNIPSKPAFNWTRFSGKWYGYVHIPYYQALTGKCMTHTYKDLPLANATLTNFNWNITLVSQGVTLAGRAMPVRAGIARTASGTPLGTANRTDIGKIAIPDPTLGEYTVSFPSAPWWQSLKVQIVDTDYDTCAVAYGCYQIPFHNKKLEFVWLKAKNRVNMFGLPNCMTALNQTGIHQDNLKYIDMFNCPIDL